MNVIKLATTNSNPRCVIKACSTCRHKINDSFGATFWKCGALGIYCDGARRDHNPCGPAGAMWEAKPPRKGLFRTIHEFLFGEQ